MTRQNLVGLAPIFPYLAGIRFGELPAAEERAGAPQARDRFRLIEMGFAHCSIAPGKGGVAAPGAMLALLSSESAIFQSGRCRHGGGTVDYEDAACRGLRELTTRLIMCEASCYGSR